METDVKSSGNKGKAKSAKGAPRPRKVRGRTVNRRRERFLGKMAKKLAKAQENGEPTDTIKLAIAASKDAQARRTSKIGKK